ncbi:MAG: YhdP family phospholipid transporter, partial [Spongiibacteraceae bacterium]
MEFREGGGMSAAQLAIGVEEPPALVDGEFRIAGQLDFASYDQWQLLAQQLFVSKHANAEKAESLPIRVNSLKIGELSIFGQLLDDVELQATEGDGAWRLHIDSRQVSGELNIPNIAGEIITAKLAKMMFPAAEKGAESPLVNFDPRSLPGLDLDIASVHMGKEELGNLGFNLRIDDGGAHFKNIRGKIRGVRLDIADQPSAQLDWIHVKDGVVYTALRGSFGLGDVGELMQRSGYDRPMESRRGTMHIDMQWPGAPDAMLLANSSGTMQFELSKGRFLKSSDTASGALRVLSIFNMANVIRRLKFDFRDVFNKGIAFDTMRGDIEVENGQLLLRQPLNVSGPSSRFEMTGSVNLYNDMTNLQLTAMLPVGSNIPWVVALLGGIPAAAGAYVVGKIFEEQVDKFSSVVYDISGTIEKPDLKLRKVFSVDAQSTGLNGSDKSPNKR